MLEENKKKLLIIIAIFIVIVIIGAIYYFIQNKNKEEYIDFEQNTENIEESTKENEKKEEVNKIIIDISGQVTNPGVIELEEGSRLIDAIKLAGGITNDADLNKINLAYILEDAQKIYIPSTKEKEITTYIVEESEETLETTSKSTSKKGGNLIININKATKEELQKLTGIGSSTAEKIIAYRKENGKFNTIEDIKNVRGIGKNKFNKIKNNICVK